MHYEGQPLAPPSTTTTTTTTAPGLWFLEPPNDNLPTPVFTPISPVAPHLWSVEECPWEMKEEKKGAKSEKQRT